jgi:cytochrome b subunit of formate dehydrogenase
LRFLDNVKSFLFFYTVVLFEWSFISFYACYVSHYCIDEEVIVLELLVAAKKGNDRNKRYGKSGDRRKKRKDYAHTELHRNITNLIAITTYCHVLFCPALCYAVGREEGSDGEGGPRERDAVGQKGRSR